VNDDEIDIDDDNDDIDDVVDEWWLRIYPCNIESQSTQMKCYQLCDEKQALQEIDTPLPTNTTKYQMSNDVMMKMMNCWYEWSRTKREGYTN